MATSVSPPAIRVDGDPVSRRHSRAYSTPDTTPIRRRQSVAARSDSQGAPASSQDVSSSRHSTSQPSRPNSIHYATDTKDVKGTPKTPLSLTPTNSGLDPLSTHIYHRTNSNTEPSIAQRLRNSGRPESPAGDNSKPTFEPAKPANALLDIAKDRRKGTSFLSRLSMRGGRKKDEDMHDSDSELGDLRTDGTYARALTSAMGAGGGFIPLYKEPPRYIRVKAHNKKTRDFNHMFLAQELMGSKRMTQPQARAPATAVGSKILKGGDAIWAAEFSLDGRYLAVAGKDHVVRVFAVISTPEERRAHEEEEAQGEENSAGERLSAPVFRTKPAREFHGHTGEVLALSWSKNNFLLSSSMDKTVRLWHMSRPDCLSTFTHKDVVTSIAFHPNDDRFFLAGSLDAHLRLWSIPDKNVAFQTATGEFITAVAFTPDGKVAICGVLSGMCSFYSTDGLKLKYQIHVRSSRGKNAKGSKITGIRTIKVPSGEEAGTVKVLVSSNDSRIRVYNLNDKVVQAKYKGLENQSSQINARFSDDASYIVCGSEDRKAYIWKMGVDDGDFRDKQPYESFDAHPEVVTTALMAPTASRQLLGASGDPIYDLCNPPPVLLRSLDERTASQTALSEEDEGSVGPKKPEESPAYIERSTHYDGNIIITTDRTGTIKVFRQDCAYSKRQQGLWESGSKFSGRIAGVGRSGSIMTRTSAGSRIHSRRGSLSMNGNNQVQLQQASEMINNWRQEVDGKRSSWNGTPVRKDRSISPTKTSRSPLNTSAANLASEARKQPYTSSPIIRGQNPTSPTSSVASNFTTFRSTKGRESSNSITGPPTPSFSLISADSDTKGDKSEGSFWNLSRWRAGLRSSNGMNGAGSNGVSEHGPPSPSPAGHIRSGSEYLTPRKTPVRMSMGAGGLERIRNEEMVNRRKSAGPTMTSGLSPRERQVTRESLSMGTKRVDSGVGRMSAESSDSVVEPPF